MNEATDEEVVVIPVERGPIRNVREALDKIAWMVRQDWFLDEIMEAIAQGQSYHGRLVCKKASQGYVVAFSRGPRSKARDNAFIRLELE